MRPSHKLALAAATLVLMLPAGLVGEDAGPGLEYPVKAAYLYQFARFTEWPDQPGARDALVVGVLGEDPFGAALDNTIDGKSVGGRRLVVRRSAFASDLDDCSILFVSTSDPQRLKALLQRFARRPVLTVGEARDFTESGGMVRFLLDGSHVRFEVNLAAVEAGGLRLSSRVLALARLTGRSTGAR